MSMSLETKLLADWLPSENTSENKKKRIVWKMLTEAIHAPVASTIRVAREIK